MSDEYARSEGVDDRTIEAAGKVGEAFEWVERARGRLYDFHHMIGRADFLLDEAADLLEDAGARQQADLLRKEIIGRNVLKGRWTFQVVEEFDATYYKPTAHAEQRIREELTGGRRHVYEAKMKERRRTPGRQGHEPRPAEGG